MKAYPTGCSLLVVCVVGAAGLADQPVGWPANGSNGLAACTPVSDGQRICAVFGTGVVACYDLDGKRLWIRSYPVADLLHGHSTSPALVGDRVIAHFKDMVALDIQTGKELWKAEGLTPRHGSLVSAKLGDDGGVITLHGDFVRVSDGKVLATNLSGTHKVFDFNTPVVGDGVVYFIGVRSQGAQTPADGRGAL